MRIQSLGRGGGEGEGQTDQKGPFHGKPPWTQDSSDLGVRGDGESR